MPPSFIRPRVSRAAVKNFSTANVRTATRTVTIAVRPRNSWPAGVMEPQKNPRYQSRMASPATAAMNAPTARNVPNGIAYLSDSFSRNEHEHADDRAEKRREDERQHHRLPAEKRADHAQHLDVAHPEPFLVADAVVDFGDQVEASRPGGGADDRVHPAGPGADQVEQDADDDARERDDVGQDLMLEIDDEEGDERPGERQPRDQEQRSGPYHR